ncbi:MAG: protein kinase [Vicinamibacterales bacterium]
MSADTPDDTRSAEAAFAAMWSSDGATRSFSPGAIAAGAGGDLPFLLTGGQRFGPYQIIRPLGKGGMGQVYEAEESDSGRRIAMKILSRGLGDDEERERFLREGRLAASLSHPNTVYVFGTTEVQGFPVIAMELAPGGTLKDIVDGTRLPVSTAVDAILQVIAGLDAAAALGILHRDVKPSNCFIDRDGRVLVGDFGLSVAPSRGDEDRTAGTILGTPGFASPEQLRGASLDLRSDIYAVGATLFYLLAGRAPFEDRSTTALINRIATEPPPSIATLRPDVPRRVGAIVATCLAGDPANRFATYAALGAALQPFGATQLASAPLVRRVLAGIVDAWILSLPAGSVNLLLGLQPLTASHRADAAISASVTVAAVAIYYGLLEGLFGASAGKALVGLRVADARQVAPGVRRAAGRALVFEMPAQIVTLAAVMVLLPLASEELLKLLTAVSGVLCLAGLFSPARKRNGYMALHDRASGTRVVLHRPATEVRHRIEPMRREAPDGLASGVRIGPYLVPAGIVTDVAAPVRVDGFDDRLQRRVWIELLPRETPPLPAVRRDLGRPTRARWLGGRRGNDGCWDAFESMDAVPISTAGAEPQPWARVRHWLADLAHEIASGHADGTLPPLDVSHVWLGQDDRVRLLEWPDPAAPRVPANREAPAAALAAAQRLMYGVAAGALLGVPPDAAQQPPQIPLPLHARTLLLSLRDAGFSSAPALRDAVLSVTQGAAALPRTRRALQVLLSASLPIVMTVVSIGGIVALRRNTSGDPQVFTLDACLNALEDVDKAVGRSPTPKSLQTQTDLEIYLAERLAPTIHNPRTWTRTFPDIGSRGSRDRALRAVSAHPSRTADEISRADATVARVVGQAEDGLNLLATPRVLLATALAIMAGTFAVVMAVNGLGALLGRGGFSFRAVGAALVDATGRPVSRGRALWRAVVTWSPMIAILLALKFGPKLAGATAGMLLLEAALMTVTAAAAIWAIARPARSIQDRIAGTWIVPR